MVPCRLIRLIRHILLPVTETETTLKFPRKTVKESDINHAGF